MIDEQKRTKTKKTEKMLFFILKILVGIGILFLLFYFYVRWLEQNTTYQPSNILEEKPSDIGLDFEDIYFQSGDNIKLHGWFIPAENAKITILFCHGNAGNIGDRMDKISFFNRLGFNLFIFDYRGYGLSKGLPSEEGLYKDALAAYDYLKNSNLTEQNNNKIIVFGASLGGAVAVDLASKKSVDGLILEGTFASAVDIARVFHPLIPSFMVNSKFDSIKKIANINIPKLIIHSEDDDIIPFGQGEKLFTAAMEPKQFLKINGGHNDAFFLSESEIEPVLNTFLNNPGNN